MADIIPFEKKTAGNKITARKSGSSKPSTKKVTAETSAKLRSENAHTLCKSGFHKWKIDKTTNFAVKQGKLQTRKVCERCGKSKIELN